MKLPKYSFAILLAMPVLALASSASRADLLQLKQQVATQAQQIKALNKRLSLLLNSSHSSSSSSAVTAHSTSTSSGAATAAVSLPQSGPYMPYDQLAKQARNHSSVEDPGLLPQVNNFFNTQYPMRITGRAMLDYANFSNTNPDAPMGNGFYARRIRLGVVGFVANNWAYNVSIGFAKNDTEVKNAFLRYFMPNNLFMTFGQFKMPFSLERYTSSLNTTFMERSLATTLADNRNLGIGLNYSSAFSDSNDFTAAIGYFGQPIGDTFSDENQSDAVTTRITDTIKPNSYSYVMFGLGGSYQNPKNGNKLRYRARPESRVTNERFVDTGNISDVSKVIKYDLQAVGVYRNFSVQTEYLRSNVARFSDKQNLSFDGWYAYASWFITGEMRTMNPQVAIFNPIDPLHSYGAWELALRYSKLNLNSHDILGGDEHNTTLALNWYVNSYVEFMAEYVKVNAMRDGVKYDPNIAQLRAQISF